MSKFSWNYGQSAHSWFYVDPKGYAWGSVAVVDPTTFAAFVRYEYREPARWAAHCESLDEAKALVQTLVGANHV